jgi:hypothetical protein
MIPNLQNDIVIKCQEFNTEKKVLYEHSTKLNPLCIIGIRKKIYVK